MTTFVDVETQDFVDAARTLTTEVGDPVATAGFVLVDALAGCAAMAGDDPGGRAWATAYDQVAGAAAAAVLDVANGSYRLAQLCAQTARNYDLAESASSARSHATRDAAVALLPGAKQVDVSGGPPSAAGGSGDTPTGWSLIESRVGYVWPNGHQDRLRSAGKAWQHAGTVLSRHAWSATLASVSLAADRLPEYDDVHAACAAMTTRMNRLAGLCATIGRSCDELAQHIDTVHTEVRSELVDLGVESIGIQVIGAAVSTVTVGIAEAPTQGAQAAKIILVAAAVAAKIEKFATLARAAAAQITLVVADAGRLAAELRALRDLRVVTVSVNGVAAFPTVVRVREGASIMRMERAAGSAPDLMLARSRGRVSLNCLADETGPLAKIAPEHRWRDPLKLNDHVKRHANKLGLSGSDDYVRFASEFLQRAIRERLPTKVDRFGDIRIWDRSAGIFAVYAKDGMCKTIYRETRRRYWNTQPGTFIW